MKLSIDSFFTRKNMILKGRMIDKAFWTSISLFVCIPLVLLTSLFLSIIFLDFYKNYQLYLKIKEINNVFFFLNLKVILFSTWKLWYLFQKAGSFMASFEYLKKFLTFFWAFENYNFKLWEVLKLLDLHLFMIL